MSKTSLVFIIMACFITIGVLSFLCLEHIKLEDELLNMNIETLNRCFTSRGIK